VVPASSTSQARSRASALQKAGYGTLVSVQQANAADSRLIRQGSWVRRRRNGSSPQFGSARSKASARRQRSAYRGWL
jgi:acyl-CoA synthetase (NDP forming)